jgi:hypothetical protein
LLNAAQRGHVPVQDSLHLVYLASLLTERTMSAYAWMLLVCLLFWGLAAQIPLQQIVGNPVHMDAPLDP